MQLWKNTEERAQRHKKLAEKEAIYKIAKIISVNSGTLGDRDYKFASALQKKTNLNETVNFLAKHHNIKPQKIAASKSDDPLDKLQGIKSGIDASIVHQIPIKKNYSEVIQRCFDNIAEKSDQSAALNYSVQALGKIESMESMRYPQIHRPQIKKNLKDLVKKSTIIIAKIKN
jgi:hypothetical protein